MASQLSRRIGRWAAIGTCLGLVFVVALLLAVRTSQAANPANADTIDMFEGMQKDEIAVRFVPKDSKEAKLTIQNKTDKPLNVKLPEAFAAMPVLAQQGAGGAAAGGRAGGGGQGMGGGMGGGGGGGMGMMYVAPQGVGHRKVLTVCLEHGKPEPRPSMPYEIKPIESLTARPAVKELCRMLGNGKIDQRTAQAAAWYLNNDMSWDQLANKRVHHANGATQPYFSPQEVVVAVRVAACAVKLAEEHKASSSAAAR
jgi:hypothetical protein